MQRAAGAAFGMSLCYHHKQASAEVLSGYPARSCRILGISLPFQIELQIQPAVMGWVTWNCWPYFYRGAPALHAFLGCARNHGWPSAATLGASLGTGVLQPCVLRFCVEQGRALVLWWPLWACDLPMSFCHNLYWEGNQRWVSSTWPCGACALEQIQPL